MLCKWEREKDMAGQIGIYYRMDWGPLGGKDMGQETKAGGWTDWLGGRRGTDGKGTGIIHCCLTALVLDGRSGWSSIRASIRGGSGAGKGFCWCRGWFL